MTQALRKLVFPSKILILAAFVAIFLNYAVKANLSGYFGFRKSPMPMAICSICGLLLSLQALILGRINMSIQLRIKRFIKALAIVEVLTIITCAVSFAIASELMAMLVILLWTVPVLFWVYDIKRRVVQDPLLAAKRQKSQITDGGHEQFISTTVRANDADIEINSQQSETSVSYSDNYSSFYNLKNHAGRCKCCCFWFLYSLVIILSVLIGINAVVEARNWAQYEVIGNLVEVDVYPRSQPNGPKQNLRINCYGQKNNKPVFLFEHGAGANGLAFAGIQDLLLENGRRSCTYDRPGYGRSDSGPNDITPGEFAEKTYQLLQKAGQTGPYILVGWSAGVQIIQMFNFYFPNNVSGMAYIDGYSNYRVLEAIRMNKTNSYVDQARSALLVLLNILRGIEPLGSGQIVGAFANFKPESIASYYTAYYQNYYFWNSQFEEVRNPHSLTDELTRLGDKMGSSKPYPYGSINLNWPDIHVPLLIMPARETVKDPDSTYAQQVLKYAEKAKNTTKVAVLAGSHSVVYDEPFLVAQELLNMF